MPEMGGFEATAAIRALERESGGAHADRRDDRARDEGRPRAVPRGGHGRIPDQAARSAAAVPCSSSRWPPGGRPRPRTDDAGRRRSRCRCWRASAAIASCSPRSAGSSSTMRRAISNGSVTRSTRAMAKRCGARPTGSKAPPRTSTPKASSPRRVRSRRSGARRQFETDPRCEAAWRALSQETDQLISVLKTLST